MLVGCLSMAGTGRLDFFLNICFEALLVTVVKMGMTAQSHFSVLDL